MRAEGRKIGRCRLAVIRTTTLRLPVLAAPLHPPPVPLFAASPLSRRAARASPPHHPRPCCALSVSPFPKSANRQRPRGSVSRLIKRRKLANEISIRLRNTLVGVVSSPPPFHPPFPLALPSFFLSLCRSTNIPDPGFVVVRSLLLT